MREQKIYCTLPITRQSQVIALVFCVPSLPIVFHNQKKRSLRNPFCNSICFFLFRLALEVFQQYLAKFLLELNKLFEIPNSPRKERNITSYYFTPGTISYKKKFSRLFILFQFQGLRHDYVNRHLNFFSNFVRHNLRKCDNPYAS